RLHGKVVCGHADLAKRQDDRVREVPPPPVTTTRPLSCSRLLTSGRAVSSDSSKAAEGRKRTTLPPAAGSARRAGVSVATTRPASTSATWSHRCCASCMSWVPSTVVTPRSRTALMTGSTATRVAVPTRGAGWAAGYRFRWPPATRRGIQVTLGCCGWWTRCCSCSRSCSPRPSPGKCWRRPGRANQHGSPAVDFLARLVAQHPVPLDAGFALIQFAVGIGFLLPRLVRPAIVGSLAWSAGIWWFGEGLGGVALGQAHPARPELRSPDGSPGRPWLGAPAAWPSVVRCSCQRTRGLWTTSARSDVNL